MSRGRGIRPLAEFPQKTPESPQQLEETGGPIALTINGKSDVVVQDAESYPKRFKPAEGARVLRGIRQGPGDLGAGRCRPAGGLRGNSA
ncbi:MAG TPA: prevent-host-death protein [Isosphaeraceae bacterium]|nr:prevent-host-death protein [Isosphaeraceae bacterium]